MRRFSAYCLAPLLALPLAANAGALNGIVKLGPAPAAGVEISLACPNFDKPAQKPSSVKTNEQGAYTLSVAATGQCQMRVMHGAQTGTPFAVTVSAAPSKFDVNLNGSLTLVH
jgi:hypothetical protein